LQGALFPESLLVQPESSSHATIVVKIVAFRL
jgi:hypothetical protein